MLPKSAIIDLTYNTLCGQISTLQQQRKLTNEDVEVILTRVLMDIKSARLIESADTILKLTQQVETLEKKEETGNGNDQSNNDS